MLTPIYQAQLQYYVQLSDGESVIILVTKKTRYKKQAYKVANLKEMHKLNEKRLENEMPI